MKPAVIITVITMVTATALLVVSCTSRAVNAAIERSSAPVLIPQGEWVEGFDFTAPPGSTDLYQLRWNFRAGATDVVVGWQVGTTSAYNAARLADGPDQDLVNEVMRAASGDGCTRVDADASTGVEPDIDLCFYDAAFARGGVNAYLVRSVQDRTLVINYNNLSGDRTIYNPDSLEARFVTADFTPAPLESSLDEHLVSIY